MFFPYSASANRTNKGSNFISMFDATDLTYNKTYNNWRILSYPRIFDARVYNSKIPNPF